MEGSDIFWPSFLNSSGAKKPSGQDSQPRPSLISRTPLGVAFIRHSLSFLMKSEGSVALLIFAINRPW